MREIKRGRAREVEERREEERDKARKEQPDNQKDTQIRMSDGSDGMPIYHRAPIHHSAITGKEDSKRTKEQRWLSCLGIET